MIKPPIRWGIVGPGVIAHEFAKDFKYVKDGVLKAVASRSTQKAHEFAKTYHIDTWYGNYQELYQDPEIDVVYVATTHNFHYQNSLEALKAGKAVLCEKPITINAGQAKELVQLAQSRKLYLMEGMWTYFLPAINKAREWIDLGRIGKLTHIQSSFGYPVAFDPHGRMYNPDLAGGTLLDMGIYPVAMAYYFTHETPQSMSVISRHATTGVDDHVVMQFDYGNVVAELSSSFRSKLPNWTYIIGTEGYIGIPLFWRARECFLYKLDECIDHFDDKRESIGFNFETNAVNRDLMEGKLQSEVVPHSVSLAFQSIMDEVRSRFSN